MGGGANFFNNVAKRGGYNFHEGGQNIWTFYSFNNREINERTCKQILCIKFCLTMAHLVQVPAVDKMTVLASPAVPSRLPGSTEFKATGAVVLAGAKRSPGCNGLSIIRKN